MKKSSIVDPSLPDWTDSNSTVKLSFEGSGPTKRLKLQESESDALFTKQSSTEIIRTYSDPTNVTLETTSQASVEEEEMRKPLVIPAAVSQFIIPWSQLKMGGKVGSGAFGDVKRAKWRDTPVAVKLLHSSDATDAFFQEASLLCNLRHPNIVSCLGVCVEDPNMAIVMELMAGNLSSLLASGPMPLKSLVSVAIGISRGLAFLHQRSPKIIHRDIKPENILIDAGGAPKLGDFGVSKESLMTMTQTKIGTPSYAAPELLNSEAYGTAVDIYSMAMVLYVMSTGVAPFATLGNGVKPCTPLQVMMKVAIHRERPIIPAHVHPKLAAIIKDCWDHFPKKRPTASQLLERLIDLEEELSTIPPSTSSAPIEASIDATIPINDTLPIEQTVEITAKGPTKGITTQLLNTRSRSRVRDTNLPEQGAEATVALNPPPQATVGRMTRSMARNTKTGQTEALGGISLGSSANSSPASSQQSQKLGKPTKSRNSSAVKKRRSPTPDPTSVLSSKNTSMSYDDEDDEPTEALDVPESTSDLRQLVHEAELEEANFRTQQRWMLQKPQ